MFTLPRAVRSALLPLLTLLLAGFVSVGTASSGSAASGCPFTATAGFGSVFVAGDQSPANGCGETLAVTCNPGTQVVEVTQVFNGIATVVQPDNEAISGYSRTPVDRSTTSSSSAATATTRSTHRV